MKQKSILFLSLFIALGSFSIKHLMEGTNSVASTENQSNKPDYFVENMKRLSYNKNGKVQNELISPLVKHFPSDDSLEFKSPKMKIHEKEGLPWNVVSDSAWVNSDRSLVILNGEVYIWRMDLEGNKQYEILTSDLTIKPLEKFAHTTKAARITTQGIVTNTVGLKVVFKEGRVQLSERVRTIYEPK